jgi:hypothetical protein
MLRSCRTCYAKICIFEESCAAIGKKLMQSRWKTRLTQRQGDKTAPYAGHHATKSYRLKLSLVACLTVCVIPVVANAGQADSQPPSDPQAYCVNRSADFYAYTGEPCKSGYQLGPGNCVKPDGSWTAVPREQCAGMAGTVALPVESGRERPHSK